MINELIGSGIRFHRFVIRSLKFDNLFSWIAIALVPVIYTIRSLKIAIRSLDYIFHFPGFQVAIWENELQSERTILCKSRERITNTWERITNKWERIPNPRELIVQFDIAICFCYFFPSFVILWAVIARNIQSKKDVKRKIKTRAYL